MIKAVFDFFLLIHILHVLFFLQYLINKTVNDFPLFHSWRVFIFNRLLYVIKILYVFETVILASRKWIKAKKQIEQNYVIVLFSNLIVGSQS